LKTQQQRYNTLTDGTVLLLLHSPEQGCGLLYTPQHCSGGQRTVFLADISCEVLIFVLEISAYSAMFPPSLAAKR